MSVYIIGDNRGQVKIGHTRDVDRRLAELQCASIYRLKILRVIDGAGQKTEKWFHKRFADYRVNGEWFVLTRDMLTVIAPDEIPVKPPSARRPSPEMQEMLEGCRRDLVRLGGRPWN